MENKDILISGAGIAGLTLAFWLKKFGFNPTIVEYSPKLREGGYAIDFWGAGFEVADRMMMVPDLRKADIGISEVSFVDKNNAQKGRMNYAHLKKLMKGRAFTLLRSDLSRIIYDHLDQGIEIIFGDSIRDIKQTGSETTAIFRSGTTRKFDLILGADGLHSKVRNIIFGDERQFEKLYEYYTVSFTIEKGADSGKAFLLYNVPGKQAAVYSVNEHSSAAFFIFTAPKKLAYGQHDTNAQKQILRDQFENTGWKCADLLSKMDSAPDFYFDTVSQVKMNNWSNGRVALVGDACYCPSLLSGQGSTLAMVGAYILAGELKEAEGDYKTAFAQYQTIFKPFIDSKQKTAQGFAKSLVPKSWLGIRARNVLVNLMFLPFLSKLFISQFMYDKLILKNY